MCLWCREDVCCLCNDDSVVVSAAVALVVFLLLVSAFDAAVAFSAVL